MSMDSSIDQHLELDTCSNINSINEDDSYIEIELDASSTTCYYNHDDGGGGDEEGEITKEYQLRISISSTISVSIDEDHHSVPKTDPSDEAPCDDSPMMTCAETGEVEVIPLNHYDSSAISKEIDEQEVEFSMEKRLCNINNNVPFNRKLGSESAQSDGGQTTTLRATRVSPYDKVDVLYATSTRKQPNLSTTAKNGGMMKLLIKFRGMKMGALLASLIKPRQHCHANNNGHKSSSSSNNKSKTFFQSKTLFQCYQKKLVNYPKFGRCNNNNNSNVKRDQGIRRSYSKNWDLEYDDENSIYGSFRSNKKSSTNNNRVMEMDLGALRGILFNAMGMSNLNGYNKGSGSKSKRSTSRSTSCDTTPIHEGFSLYSSDENSNIQAAIAYCKSSLGQTSEFSF